MSVTGVEGGEPVRVGVLDRRPGRRHVGRDGHSGGAQPPPCHRRRLPCLDLAVRDRDRLDGARRSARYLSGGPMRRPMGSGVAEIVPHQAFPTSDGYIMVAAGNDNLFRALCGALDAGVRRRSALRDEFEARGEPPHADPDAGRDLPRAVERRVADAARRGGRAGGPDRERRAGRRPRRRPQRSACCRRRPIST